jgi:predicted Rossmann fold nucleotide-binding protein DprA/Smf involved in DNA uptake
MLFGVGRRPARRSAADELDDRLRAILDGVEGGESVDAMSRSASLSAADVRAALGRLELLGLVVREGVGTYRRTART